MCLNTTVPKQEAIDDWVWAKYKIACLWHTIHYYEEHSNQTVLESLRGKPHTKSVPSVEQVEEGVTALPHSGKYVKNI